MTQVTEQYPTHNDLPDSTWLTVKYEDQNDKLSKVTLTKDEGPFQEIIVGTYDADEKLINRTARYVENDGTWDKTSYELIKYKKNRLAEIEDDFLTGTYILSLKYDRDGNIISIGQRNLNESIYNEHAISYQTVSF